MKIIQRKALSHLSAHKIRGRMWRSLQPALKCSRKIEVQPSRQRNSGLGRRDQMDFHSYLAATGICQWRREPQEQRQKWIALEGSWNASVKWIPFFFIVWFCFSDIFTALIIVKCSMWLFCISIHWKLCGGSVSGLQGNHNAEITRGKPLLHYNNGRMNINILAVYSLVELLHIISERLSWSHRIRSVPVSEYTAAV